jgi:hypothetical protein
MLKGLAAGVIAIGLLIGCTTIALEALGILFQVGIADPDEQAEAEAARMLANIDPRDLPSELGDVPAPVATPAPDRREAAVAPAPEEPAVGQPTPASVSESEAAEPSPGGKIVAQADTGQTPAAESAAWAPAIVVAELPSSAPQAQPCAAPCAGKPVALPDHKTPARSERRKLRRADSRPDCLVLRWLEAVLGAPAT